MIKQISINIIDPITYIFNLCLKQGIFPEKFKLAIVKPLYKSREKENILNYKPISLLYNFSKILEKIVKNQLIRNKQFDSKKSI